MTKREGAREREREGGSERERGVVTERDTRYLEVVVVRWLDDCVFTALIVPRAQRRGNCVGEEDSFSSAARAEFDQTHIFVRGVGC